MPAIAKKLACCIGLAAVMFSNSFGASSLTVKLDSLQDTVRKEVYGTLMERLGKNWVGGIFVGTTSSIPNTNGMRNDIINGMADCGLGAIEWPGGCAANGYNWKSVGPSPANDVGTDRFMQLCTMVGCEPVLALPPAASSAANNLDWIKYINNNTSHPEWKVKWVKIGNEMWGGCGTTYTEANYETLFNASYDSLKTPVNGRPVNFIGANGYIGSYQAWQDSLVKHIGSKFQAIEVHDYIYYPSTDSCIHFTGAQYADVVNRANKGQIGPRITDIINHIRKYDTSKKLKLFEDEWGDWFVALNEAVDGWLQQITVLDALVAAEHLHLFMHHSDYFYGAALAQGINVIQSLFLTRSSDAALVKTPTYYVFKLFKPHHSNGAMSVYDTLTSEKFGSMDALTSCTTVDSLGHVNISISNVDTLTARTLNITLRTTKSFKIDSARIVTGPKKNSYNDYGAAELVNIQRFADSLYSISNGSNLTVTMPPMSIVMLQLSQNGGTGVGQNGRAGALKSNMFSILPRSNGSISVTSLARHEGAVTISLYNANGKMINRTLNSFKPNSSVVLKNDLKAGIYIVKLESANGGFSKNVAVVR